MTHINKQKFLAELAKLLGFMSVADRQAAIEKYAAMFDSCDSESQLIMELGSPTKLAISLAREYVPSPADETGSYSYEEDKPAPSPTADAACPTEASAAAQSPFVTEADGTSASSEEADIMPTDQEDESKEPQEESGPLFEGSAAISRDMLDRISRNISRAAGENVEEDEEDEAESETRFIFEGDSETEELAPPKSSRRAKPVALVFYIILSIVIGLPVAIVLICFGLPFLATGAGIVVGSVYAAVKLIAIFSMFSDILLSCGAALVASALGLVVAWFGIWVCLELGYLWIGKVIFRLGGKLCFRKEEAE